MLGGRKDIPSRGNGLSKAQKCATGAWMPQRASSLPLIIPTPVSPAPGAQQPDSLVSTTAPSSCPLPPPGASRRLQLCCDGLCLLPQTPSPVSMLSTQQDGVLNCRAGYDLALPSCLLSCLLLPWVLGPYMC